MCFRRLLPSVLLVASAVASPSSIKRNGPIEPHSLETLVKTNVAGGMKNVIANDRARLQALFLSRKNSAAPASGGSNKPTFASGKAFNSSSSTNGANVPVPVIDSGFLTLANVQVGNPPSQYQLIVDTGSSNTFVGANTPYVPTQSSHDTGNQVSVSYGSGSFSGEEFLDDVTLGTATVTQSIGVASQSVGFNGLDGILGLGPDDLTLGTTSNGGTVPTVTDNLAQQGKAASALVGVSIPLTTGTGGNAGSLDFGTPDTTKFNGKLAFVPVTQTSPSNQFWGIDQSVTYGNNKLPILKATSGIVDTGTTLMYMASDAFSAYVSATGATTDPTTGLLTVKNPANLQSLFFNMGGNTFEFTANAQIFPSSLNTAIGGTSGTTYLIVQDIGTNSGQGLDFINGFTFLQRFYSVFDTPNQQVGFATTPQTTATSN